MNNNKTILIALAMVLGTIAFTAFTSNQKAGQKEYLTIYLEDGDFSEVHISTDGKDFKKINMVPEYRATRGFNPMINLIHEYEKDGWEIMGMPGRFPYGGRDSKYGAGMLVMMTRPAR